MKPPEVIVFPTPTIPDKKLYFDNNRIEDLMLRYRWTGCTNKALRDNIMSNTEELIRQIIRTHNLHRIYPGQEESAFMDLFQTAWVQIERTLYKYKARVHCAECYSPIRPMDSCIYNPGILDYEILCPEDVGKLRIKCPVCGQVPKRIIYRGCSKIFNLWCVRPETLIYTTSGINTIENVAHRAGYDDRQEIWTLGAEGKPSKIVAGITKSSRPVLDIKTRLGFEIGCTPEHSIFCDDGQFGSMKKAADIRVGDLIAVQYNQQFYIGDDDLSNIVLTSNKPGCSGVTAADWQPPKKFNQELAYILGLYIAEGSCTKGQCAIYNIDNDVIQKLVHNNLGLKFIHHPKMQCVICCNKRFVEFIGLFGFGSRAQDKQIPGQLLKMSADNIAAMLSGMFDGDGHSSRHNGSIGYTSTSKRLIGQLRMLLLNLGILTKISVDKRKLSKFNRRGKRYTSVKRASYQLLLPSTDSKRFYDIIGFGIKRKQLKSTSLPGQIEFIYGVNTRFRRLYSKYGCGRLGYDKIRTIIRPDRVKCNINKAEELLANWAEYSFDGDYKFIESSVNGRRSDGVRTAWLPVVEINKSESVVCEISVDSDDHSYIANGIISHNSQIARTVILAHIKKETRDHKNSDSYRGHLDNQNPQKTDEAFARFLGEARALCKHNVNHMIIVDTLENMVKTDDRPYEGIIGKLVKLSGQSRAQVAGFLRLMRLRCDEFSDSPMNDKQKQKLKPAVNEDEW